MVVVVTLVVVEAADEEGKFFIFFFGCSGFSFLFLPEAEAAWVEDAVWPKVGFLKRTHDPAWVDGAELGWLSSSELSDPEHESESLSSSYK